MTTRAFAVKRKLFEVLSADPPAPAAENNDDESVPIWYGYKTTQNRPREVIWIGEIRWSTEDPVSLGNLSRDETFEIVVTIEVHVPGYTQEQANDRAEILMGYLEEAVRDPRWSGLALNSSGLRPQYLGEGADSNNSRGAVLVTLLRVTARK
jgi:hypothetical protein